MRRGLAALALGSALLVCMGSATAEIRPSCLGRTATVVGTSDDDHLFTTSADDVVAGLGGNDFVVAMHPSARVCGGPGNDVITGTLEGGIYTLVAGGSGADRIRGARVTYRSAPAPVVVDLVAGTATGQGSDVLDDVSEVVGSRFADTFIGGVKSDGELATLRGGPGNDDLRGGTSTDTLRGGRGDDRITGWAGNDSLVGGPGDDLLEGGGGLDSASFLQSRRGVIANVRSGVARGEGKDTLLSIESLRGSRYDDVLLGDRSANALWGFAGADLLVGGAGFDALWGHAGRDRMWGNLGADVLRGYSASDLLRGGAGTDALYGGSGLDDCRGGEKEERCP